MKWVLLIFLEVSFVTSTTGQGMPFLNFENKREGLNADHIETIEEFFSEREDMKKYNVIIILNYFVYTDYGKFKRRDLNRLFEAKQVLIDCGFNPNRIYFRMERRDDWILSKYTRIDFQAFLLQ